MIVAAESRRATRWDGRRGFRVHEKRLRAAVASIEEQPKRWNQNVYAGLGECGSTYCLAGWTCVQAGFDPAEMLKEDSDAVFEKARELLCLTYRQAKALFLYGEDEHHEHPTIEQFKARVAEVTGVLV